MPQATMPKSAIWKGKRRSSQDGPEEEDRKDRREREPLAHAPANVDEERHDAEQEERDRDDLDQGSGESIPKVVTRTR